MLRHPEKNARPSTPAPEEIELVRLVLEARKQSYELIKEFVSRAYRGPRPPPRTKAASEYTPLDLLKCFDLYHFKALDEHVKKYVNAPDAQEPRSSPDQ